MADNLEPTPTRTWPYGLVAAALFAVFAAVEWGVVSRLFAGRPVRDLFDLTFLLFEGFWALAWAVPVVILGAIAAALLLFPALVQTGFINGVAERAVSTLVRRAATARPMPPPEAASPSTEREAPALLSASGVALIAANLIPLGGVLFYGWSLPNILVLFWAESVVIGIYTILKMLVVEGAVAILTVPFFVGHFGAFMAFHLLFIYEFFIRGLQAAGPAAGVRDTLISIFAPVRLSLLALVISHGVSFYSNFIRGREYVGSTLDSLTKEPYRRLVMMHLTIIFGGWIVMLLGTPVGALALLVLIKTVVDFSAHTRQHARS